MFRLDQSLKVYLHRAPVDLRLGINGLATLVQQALGLDPFAACVYVLGNRRRNRVMPRVRAYCPPDQFRNPMSTVPDTLELRPGAQAVARAVQWIEGIARRDGWPARSAFALTLCLDEALTNIVSYAFDPPARAPAVRLFCRRAGPNIELELRDNGQPYDPTAAKPAPLASSLDEASIGGHGVRLMRHYLQSFAYRREGNCNCLTMTVVSRHACNDA